MEDGAVWYFYILGGLIIALGGVAGVYFGEEVGAFTGQGFNIMQAGIYWLAGLISGSIFIGIGKVISQLNQIIEQT